MKKLFLTLAVAAAVFVATQASADLFWGSAAPQWDGSNPVIFQFDTITGTVGTKYQYSDWMWIISVAAAPNNNLYAVHNTTADKYGFKLARIDASTGAVLSSKPLNSIVSSSGYDWNALHYHAGKLYAVENSGVNRGRVYEISLDSSGDPLSGVLGAYIGPVPDGALTFKDGLWYASDWRNNSSSYIQTTTNIASGTFAPLAGGPGYTTGVGLVDGWDFDSSGRLLAVSWSNQDFNVYNIDLPSGNATALYNLQSQLPSNLNRLTGLSAPAAPIPEPVFFQMGAMLGLGGLGLLRFRRR